MPVKNQIKRLLTSIKKNSANDTRIVRKILDHIFIDFNSSVTKESIIIPPKNNAKSFQLPNKLPVVIELKKPGKRLFKSKNKNITSISVSMAAPKNKTL